MKNQYVGDINDFRKYGLIRSLTGKSSFRVGICWMLTANDGRNDGQILDYLNQPELWRHYDPSLYDKLHKAVKNRRHRNVFLIQNSNILPGAAYAACPLPDGSELRNDVITYALDSFSQCELVFFDPDNGLEVKSKPLGRKGSNKYLYLSEVTQAFKHGHSLIIYQHFPRINRNNYITSRIDQLRKATRASTVFSLSTSFVCFFVVPQRKHIVALKKRLNEIHARWGSQFALQVHAG
jgi:hypothetical protein